VPAVQPELGEAVAAAETELEDAGFLSRINAGDPSLWPGDQDAIRNRLGWLPVVAEMRGHAVELNEWAAEVGGTLPHAVLLGMGGSSLCPEVLRRTFDSDRPDVTDTTYPDAVRASEHRDALYLVASKSGGTLETRSHEAYFWERTGGDPSRFAAVTDPGTDLERTARERSYRRVFANRPDIGGRYSALSYFGLVAAALAGIDVAALLDTIKTGEDGPEIYGGMALGAALGGLARKGRNKVTIVAEGRFASFGLWAEQLIAESTGKQGTGLVPVAGEELGDPDVYADDRVFVHLRSDGSNDAALHRLAQEGHPVLTREVSDPHELANEFLQWEVATAAAGMLLGINPFDEPNVAESKANTARILQEWERSGDLPDPESDSLDDVFRAIEPGGYVAIMAYVDPTEPNEQRFRSIRTGIRDRHRVATTFGFGPRFLHSTGQLHKGGPQVGCFIQVVDPDPGDLPIPGKPFGFGTLIRAQAIGDLQALRGRGRPVARVTPDELEALAAGHR
jgi:glucose-6-phosphate isomerase/transaldolase/glucose-6-phosphate isomerase